MFINSQQQNVIPPSSRSRRLSFISLLLLVPAPSIGVVMAMYIVPGIVGQTIFTISKIWLVLFPIVWIYKFDREKIVIPQLSTKGMKIACLAGLIIFSGIAISYFIVNSFGLIDPKTISSKVKAVGLVSPQIYFIGAIYWCTINSLIEEYVWRWFVFTRCEKLMPQIWAVFASALFFTLHHFFALYTYFSLPMTIVASIGVFIGGTTWSWIYLRYRNIYASYLSHVFADIIIFLIAYQLIF